MPASRHVPLKNEYQLIEQAVRGDGDAFGVLYLQYMDAIYRYIAFRVDDEKLAEDLTEEVFIKAWEALPRYKSGGYPLSSWLYSIARNLLVDFYRKHKEKPLSVDELHVLNKLGLSTEGQVEQQIKVEDLRQAILKLNPEEQQVIILRFIEDVPYKQIGIVIGKSEGACRVIQYRALKRLSLLLSHSDADDSTFEHPAEEPIVHPQL